MATPDQATDEVPPDFPKASAKLRAASMALIPSAMRQWGIAVTATALVACGYGVAVTTPSPAPSAASRVSPTPPLNDCSLGSIRPSEALQHRDQTVTVCYRVADAKTITGANGQPTLVTLLYSTKPQRPDDFMTVILRMDATLIAIVTPPERLVGVRVEVRGEIAADNPSLPPQMIVSEPGKIRVIGP